MSSCKNTVEFKIKDNIKVNFSLTSSYNWFEYCDKQPDGEKLSTSVGPGIDNSWVKTGNIYGYGEKIVTTQEL